MTTGRGEVSGTRTRTDALANTLGYFRPRRTGEAPRVETELAMPRQASTRNLGFNFHRGQVIARRYKVVERLGVGYESEVYLLRECTTGIERAGKFFYPNRNPRDLTLKRHATRLHKLRHCPMVVQYHAQDSITVHDQPVSFLVCCGSIFQQLTL